MLRISSTSTDQHNATKCTTNKIKIKNNNRDALYGHINNTQVKDALLGFDVLTVGMNGWVRL